VLQQALPELPLRAVYLDSTWSVKAIVDTPAEP